VGTSPPLMASSYSFVRLFRPFRAMLQMAKGRLGQKQETRYSQIYARVGARRGTSHHRMLNRLWVLTDRYGLGFIAYFGVGFASALTEWSAFLISLILMSPEQAALVGFTLATAANFLLSRRFVFVPVHSLIRDLVLVMAVSASAFVLNFVVFYLLYTNGTFPLIAKMCGTGVGFVFNYALRQFVIFSRNSRLPSISIVLQNNRGAASDGQGKVNVLVEP
jgi:putative flippase GtrA